MLRCLWCFAGLSILCVALWMACSQPTECTFDGDCKKAQTRCVNGLCVAREVVVSESDVPDVQTPEVECQDGHQRVCYSGSGKIQGICKEGKQICANGKWGVCEGEILPKAKEDCNGLDDNCNGTVDEGCDCKPGEKKPCYTGPVGTQGQGICQEGQQTCGTDGTWGECSGSVAPVSEECNNIDDDCDGSIDEDLYQECYTGPDKTRSVGICKAGRKRCAQGKWGECTDDVKPIQEKCGNQLDDDCDGVIDEGNGRALQFSGNQQSVEIPHHASLHLTGSFTIELWVYFAGVGNKSLMILVNKHKRAVDDSGYQLKIVTGNQCEFSWWRPNDGDLLKLGACPVNQWTHLAFVYDKSENKYRFYVDGKRQIEHSPIKPINAGANVFPVVLGSESDSLGTPDFSGKMASVRISSAARYTGASFLPTCTFPNDPQTLGLWNMEEGGGSQLKDLSNAQNHGQIKGAVWDNGRSCNAVKPEDGCVP